MENPYETPRPGEHAEPAESPQDPASPILTETMPDADRTMAILLHLSPLAGFVIPFANLIAPLVIWLIKKDASQVIDAHGREVLNFQIVVLILAIICGVLIVVVIGIFLLPLLGLVTLICMMMGAVKASNGELFRYPVPFRFL